MAIAAGMAPPSSHRLTIIRAAARSMPRPKSRTVQFSHNATEERTGASGGSGGGGTYRANLPSPCPSPHGRGNGLSTAATGLPSPLAGEGWGEGEPKSSDRRLRQRKTRKRRVMVNPGVVNAGSRIFRRRAFANFLRVLGRIPCFQNPFKYTGKFNVNHKTVHFRRACRPPRFVFASCYQWLSRVLKTSARSFGYHGRRKDRERQLCKMAGKAGK